MFAICRVSQASNHLDLLTATQTSYSFELIKPWETTAGFAFRENTRPAILRRKSCDAKTLNWKPRKGTDPLRTRLCLSEPGIPHHS